MPKTDGYKTRAKILVVAENLFAKKGFNGTCIDMIAKAAKVNKGLIYYHFKDKEDIVLSIFQNIINEIGDNVNVQYDDQIDDVTSMLEHMDTDSVRRILSRNIQDETDARSRYSAEYETDAVDFDESYDESFNGSNFRRSLFRQF